MLEGPDQKRTVKSDRVNSKRVGYRVSLNLEQYSQFEFGQYGQLNLEQYAEGVG